jgi:MFS family permease
VWALFSAGTGLAVSIGMLAVARIGAGIGKAVVTPTHSSLLADFYPPDARVKVFSAHRLASSVGQILGPILVGGSPWRWAGGRRSSSSRSPPRCSSSSRRSVA